MDLGCALIKKFVTEKAVEDVDKDEIINLAVTKRQDAKKKNEPFTPDPNVLRTLSYLPEALKPGSNGLTAEQFKIYEDFLNIPREKKRDTTI